MRIKLKNMLSMHLELSILLGNVRTGPEICHCLEEDVIDCARSVRRKDNAGQGMLVE